ncbi:MAG: hypothetical protein ISEC1_P0559 [Thiomicrorhabdus sp.]|nr:MAG: hypothetical protein ISEC1_P0559 [Thiomicrorhabdus sp.]
MLETTLISAIALVFILEGLLPFVFPGFWKKMMTQAIQSSEKDLRVMGIVSITIGMAILIFLSE